MTLKALHKLIQDDLFRYAGEKGGLFTFLRVFALVPGFSCTFWYRVCYWVNMSKFRRFFFYPIVLFRKRSERVWHTVIAGDIAGGLCVGHAEAGGIVINGACKIGKNCNIHHGVTIGAKHRALGAGKTGAPEIGDNVYIGPGAKVIGGIKIGNNVAIGANAVVVHDVPDNAVVGGVPAKIISYGGSEGLVCRRV